LTGRYPCGDNWEDDIATYLLKAIIVEPEKQSLLGNFCVIHYNRVTVGSDVFFAVRADTI
jgi:hypothetical protein